MRHRGYTEIEHPEAYANAVRNSIYARANAKRARAWEAAHPQLAAWVNHRSGYDDAGREIARHPLGYVPTFIREAIDQWGAPSEKATAVLQRIFDERTANAAKRADERAAEAASATAWQPGRQVVEGVIISVKETQGFSPSPYYAAPTVWKMLVKRQDGSKIYASIPAQLEGRAEDMRGKQVRFTVTVEPKEGEPTFAFGKRPAKAEFITTTQEG